MLTIIGGKALHSLLEYTHKHGKSYWYKIYDNEKDFKSDIEIDFGTPSSLQRHCKLRREQYIALLVQCGLLTARGDTHRLQIKKFETLLTSLNIEGEIRPYDPKGGVGQRLYVRLGHKNNGYHKNVTDQVEAKASKPPRIGGLTPLQTDLTRELSGITDDNNSSSDGESSESEDESDDDNDDYTEKQMRKTDSTSVDKQSTIDITITSAKEMEAGFTLSRLSDSQLKYYIGLLISEQQKRKNKKRAEEEEEEPPATTPAVVTPIQRTTTSKSNPFSTMFEFTQGDRDYNGVTIPTHKNESAFASYQQRKPYVKDIVRLMGTKKHEEIKERRGAKRLLNHLAKNFPTEYARVGKKRKLQVNGMLDATALAAWQIDADIRDHQMITSLKHLRCGLDCKVAVPFHKTKAFCQGYVEPKTKEFEHQYKDKTIEIIKVEYQDVSAMLVITAQEIISENGIKVEDVKEIFFVIGGDHGLGAFRLSFRVIVMLKNGKMYVKGGITATIFGKDTPEVLEKSIMKWITDDLRRSATAN